MPAKLRTRGGHTQGEKVQNANVKLKTKERETLSFARQTDVKAKSERRKQKKKNFFSSLSQIMCVKYVEDLPRGQLDTAKAGEQQHE